MRIAHAHDSCASAASCERPELLCDRPLRRGPVSASCVLQCLTRAGPRSDSDGVAESKVIAAGARAPYRLCAHATTDRVPACGENALTVVARRPAGAFYNGARIICRAGGGLFRLGQGAAPEKSSSPVQRRRRCEVARCEVRAPLPALFRRLLRTSLRSRSPRARSIFRRSFRGTSSNTAQHTPRCPR